MASKNSTQSGAQFNLGAFLTKNSMIIALIVVFILFYFLTGRTSPVRASNMSNLLLQERLRAGLWPVGIAALVS